MDGIWGILELEPTQDVSAIRRAYAEKTRTCHPEEDPSGFMELRQAYQAAMAYAESGTVPQRPAAPDHEPLLQEDGEHDCEERQEPDEDEDPAPEKQYRFDWTLSDEEADHSPNPYVDHEAIQKFEELYMGKQRKNPKLWMDYFTSNTFLDVAWEPRFTELLLEKVKKVEITLPPTKEFLMWLSVVYLFSVKDKVSFDRAAMRLDNLGRSVQLSPEADFEGLESILRIVAKGAPPKALRGNEFAISQSFQDYRHLARLTENGRWNEQAVAEYRDIVGRYVSAYIKERCEQRVAPDLERHLVGLRVFTHFFEGHELPEELYRFLWDKLGLKMAIMGRSKIMYGRLREIVTARVPGIDGEAVENFLALNRALDVYLAKIKEHPEQEETESAAFYDREDMQKALHSGRFVEKELLTYSKWRRDEIGEGLLRRILGYYQENPDVPGAEKVMEGMKADLQKREVVRHNREDAEAEVPAYYVRLTLAYRPFFRHWLNTGFYAAQDPESGTLLSDYLKQRLPYQEEWSRRFLQKEDGTIQPRVVAVCMGEMEVELHLRHMEFRINGRPVHRPCLLWERAVIESGEWFLLLLPITVAPRSWFTEVERTIIHHLAGTAALEEDRAFIAGCLAGRVCCLPEDDYTKEPIPPEEALPMEFFAEDEDRLYGCSWYEAERRLVLFEQTASGRRVNKECELGLEVEDAATAARQMLDEMVSPEHFDLSQLRELPWHVYFTPNDGPEQGLIRPDLKPDPEGEEQTLEDPWDSPVLVEGEDEDAVPPKQNEQPQGPAEDEVTEEVLSASLYRFAKGELRRLELDWFDGKLVITKEAEGYACLYFGNIIFNDIWYSMVSKPEVYRTAEEVEYVPFGMGKLPSYSLFDSAAAILRNLDRVLPQMGQKRIDSEGPSEWLWACHPSLQNGQHKLIMAQQKLGGVSSHRGRNRLEVKFVMNQYPVEMESVDLNGEQTLTEIRSGSYGQTTSALSLFMKERFAKLRLSWEFKSAEGGVFRRHMVLLQDSGRFMMLWLQDDKERAEYYIVETGADTEVEKQGEVTFLGRTVPAHVVHHELLRIRNCVDLLLDDITYTDPVTERPGEFAPIGRSYKAVRAKLIGQEE